MSDHLQQAFGYAKQQHDRFLHELIEFSALPSVSTDPAYLPAMQQTAEWVASQLRQAGVHNVGIHPTAGHPVVYGEWLGAGADAKTVLIYGHYDVQPAVIEDGWDSDPFKPEVRGENLFARGATDMKAQVLASIKAVEAILATGALPVNVKFMIEGEEEIGSPSLDAWMRANKDLLACDLALNPDTGMLAPNLPTITYALRGLAYFELRLSGPRNDLHSGVFGGAIHNPAQVLAELIAGMHDAEGRVTLPGFYDRVRPLNAEERAELARLPLDEQFFLAASGVPALWEGEAGYTAMERVGARPTLEINGMISGFTGPGSKTVLPAQAMAKISCRLVPDQDPAEVEAQLKAYLNTHAPKTVTWQVITMAGSPAAISDRESFGVQAMRKALESAWGTRPLFKREGGSVPVVTQFQRILGVESVNTGFALPDDNMHGPNEKTHLPTWAKGLHAFMYFFFNMAA